MTTNLEKAVRILIATLAVLLLASLSALANSSAKIDVPYAASLKGNQLEAGRYKISWDEQTPNVTLTVAQGKEVVATVEGKLVERDTRYSRNMIVIATGPDGAQKILEIRLGGRNQAIVFTD